MNHALAFDASLLSVGAVAVLERRIAEAATFAYNGRELKGVEKYAAAARTQAAQVRAFLDRYARDIPVLVEVPANGDGTVWQKHSTFTTGLGAGVVAGVALALGFDVMLIPAGVRGGIGGKEQKALLSRALRGVALKTEHELDAAAIAAWYIGGAE